MAHTKLFILLLYNGSLEANKRIKKKFRDTKNFKANLQSLRSSIKIRSHYTQFVQDEVQDEKSPKSTHTRARTQSSNSALKSQYLAKFTRDLPM